MSSFNIAVIEQLKSVIIKLDRQIEKINKKRERQNLILDAQILKINSQKESILHSIEEVKQVIQKQPIQAPSLEDIN